MLQLKQIEWLHEKVVSYVVPFCTELLASALNLLVVSFQIQHPHTKSFHKLLHIAGTVSIPILSL